MTTVVRAARLVDGTGGPPLANPEVVVEGGVIVAVSSGQRREPGPGDQVHHFQEGTILPGLLDAHVHLTLSAGVDPVAQMLVDTNDYLLLRAAKAAQTALRAGITTLRDCGGRDSVCHTLRAAIKDDVVVGSHLLVSGRPITTVRGHCYFMNGEARDTRQAVALVEEEIGRGADFIKVMATGGGLTPGTYPKLPQFTAGQLRQIVETAHARGRKVAAHAHGTPGIRNCLDAGIDTIEHCTFLTDEGIRVDEDLLERLVRAGTFVVTTVVPLYYGLTHDCKPNGVAAAVPGGRRGLFEARMETIRRMKTAGVRLVAGSDAGVAYTGFDTLLEELELLTQAGFSNSEAIVCATSLAADALGIAAEAGTIATSKRADLLVVWGNPLEDIKALRKTALVLKAGCVVEGAGEPR